MLTKVEIKRLYIIIVFIFLMMFITGSIPLALIVKKIYMQSHYSLPEEITYISPMLAFLFAEAIVLVGSVLLVSLFFKKTFNKITYGANDTSLQLDKAKKQVDLMRKQLEDLARKYDNLLENSKSKTEFFANVSHELKMPLSVILGAIQLIEQKQKMYPQAEDTLKLNKHFQTIRKNCYRLLRLVNNILDLSRIEAGQIKFNLQNVNIVMLLDEIMQSVVPYAEQKGLTLIFDTSCEDVMTAIDVDKFERVVLNLLSNAIKFTKSGGKVTVRMDRGETSVFISVKDTGLGIPASKINSVFERFGQVNSSLSREAEGSGIGLCLVKSFVELHGGTIKVISEENKGSEFIIELPIKICESDESEKDNVSSGQSRIVNSLTVEFSDIYSAAS